MKPKTIHRAIKYRLFPDEEQEIQINRTFGCVRKVYNMGLEMQMGLYASGFKTMSKTDMNNYCNRAWKTEFPFLREVDKFALTHSIYDLDAAYKNFFEGRAKFPRFKSKKNPRNSYTTNFTNENISVTGGKNGKGSVKLPKLGSVDAKVHRIPPANWNITGATISKSASGKYFVSILFSIQAKIPAPQLDEDNAIGLDYSSPDFYEDSDGNKPNVPHAYRKSERRLAKEQWICPGCGKIIPRNKNAALNIRDEGLRVYQQRAR